MIDLAKSYEFFNPNSVKERIHIIGCGSVGATIAENLCRLGLTKFTLWDFDKVCSHNLANQIFRQDDIGRRKTEALLDIMKEINPDVEESTKLKSSGWNGEQVSGIVFLCLDSIELRRKFVEENMMNTNIRAIFDIRTLLTGAQIFGADWSSEDMKSNLLNSMNFSDKQAEESTPVSACGVTLGVAPTVRIACAYQVANFVNWVQKGKNNIKKLIAFDAFSFDTIAF